MTVGVRLLVVYVADHVVVVGVVHLAIGISLKRGILLLKNMVGNSK